MTSQPIGYDPDLVIQDLEESYKSDVTPAVKALAAAYLAYHFGVKSDSSNSMTQSNYLSIIIQWITKLRNLATFLFSMPHFGAVAVGNVSTFEDTLQKLAENVTEFGTLAPNDATPRKFIKNGSADPTILASQLLLRLQWSLDWVKQHREATPPEGATHKVWVSHLDAKTCSVACRKMHGTKVPVAESFTASALEAGVPQGLLYGQLWGPPIHPNCRCHLIYV